MFSDGRMAAAVALCGVCRGTALCGVAAAVIGGAGVWRKEEWIWI